MQKQEYLYRGPNHAVNLNNMRLTDKYCDVTIKVDGTEIRAHKVVLAANLKYFEMMFSSDSFQESQDGVITMKSVEKADLELLVSYAYTGEILLTDSNAWNLLELANYLSEDDIKEACIRFLEKHLKAEEACRAYKFANTIECLSLKNAAKAKIIANFGDCSESADFLNFDPDSLMDILSDGKAQSTEMQKMLFEGTLRWIIHDAKVRKMHMEDLLNSIDISKLNGDDVTSRLFKYVLHRNDKHGITNDAIIYYEASKRERKEQEQIIGYAGSVQFYNFAEKKWSSQQQNPSAAFQDYANCSSAVLNYKLYYISQISGKNYLQVFDPSSKQDTRLHSSSSILKGASLCACSKFVYICGGLKENNSRLNPILKYDPLTKSWETVAPMKHARSDQFLWYDPQTNSLEALAPMKHVRSNPAVIFYQDYIYVLGGFDGSSYLQSVEKFDPVRNEWTALASMCKNRCAHAVAILDGKLYACGGISCGNYEASVEVYDSTTNSWHLVASMNKARRYFLLVAHKGKLLAIGGSGEKTIEAYDPSKDQWQMDDELSSGLQEASYVGGLFPSSCISNTK